MIALVVTPEGFPLAYEVMPGNTSDKTTLRAFLRRIETQYGKAERIWVMDRGIPTEEVLAEMRQSDPPIHYLVGTPKGRLTKLEAQLTALPWEQVREGIEVKLLPQEGELYVFAQSRERSHKERSMRRRALRKLLTRLGELRTMSLKRDQLLLKLGEAKAAAGRAYYLVDLRLPAAREAVSEQTFRFKLNRAKLRLARRREGRLPVAQQSVRTDAGQTLGTLYPADPGRRSFQKPEKATWQSVLSTISARRGSKRISSSPFSPTACKSPSPAVCAIWRRDSPPARSSISSPPCK